MDLGVLVFVLCVVSGWIAGIVAAFRVGALSRRLRRLEQRIDPEVYSDGHDDVSAPSAKPAAPSIPLRAKPAPKLAPWARAEEDQAPVAAPDLPNVDEPASEPAVALSGPASIESRFAASWIVWSGGVMVALAAVFFFRYAIDAGWLTEQVRVAMGLLAGAAMVAGGDILARRRAVREASGAPGGLPDFVPDALGGAGFFTLYATVWAAHALFGILGGAAAFIGLAAVAIVAMALSLRQGWRIGLLGVLGAFLVPALVESTAPQAAPLFMYLAVVSVAGLWIFLGQRVRLVRLALITGTFFWPALWLADRGGSSAITLGYLLAMALAYGLLGRGRSGETSAAQADPPHAMRNPWEWVLARFLELDLADGALVLSGLLVAAHAPWISADAGLWWLVAPWIALAMATSLTFAGSRPLGPIVAATAVILLLALWPAADAQPWLEMRAMSMRSQMPPPDAARVTWAEMLLRTAAALSAALALSAVGTLAFAASRRGLIATAGVFGPVSAYLIGWLRTDGMLATFGLVAPPEPIIADGQWAAVALGFSLCCAALALWRLRQPPPDDPAAAILTAGATTGLTIAATFVFRDNWLALALAAEVAAIAAAWRMTSYAPLRTLAAAVAVVMAVTVGLTLAAEGLFEGADRGFIPVLTGWVAPGAALWVAAGLFLREEGGAPQRLPDWLRAAAMTLFALAGALMIRVLLAGAPFAAVPDRLEQALQTLWAMGAAMLLFRVPGATARWLGTALSVLALTLLGLGSLLLANPAFAEVPIDVGGLPVLNLVGLLYLAPAAVLFATPWPARDAPPPLPQLRLSVAGVLLWAWASLEALRTASGGVVSKYFEYIGEAGLWAVSAAWVLLAAAALALGLLRDLPRVRLYALGLLAMTALKVVFVDLEGLSGLWRVASLLGLGLTLLAIGEAYRRFNRAPKEPAPPPAPDGPSPAAEG